MYCESLQSMGFDPKATASVEEALRIAVEMKPAVLVTDLRFNGAIDGIELIRRLREDRRTSGVRTILLTGVAMGEDRDRAEASGCDRLLLKPCLPEALASEIRRLAVSQFSPGRDGGNLHAPREAHRRSRSDRRKV